MSGLTTPYFADDVLVEVAEQRESSASADRSHAFSAKNVSTLMPSTFGADLVQIGRRVAERAHLGRADAAEGRRQERQDHRPLLQLLAQRHGSRSWFGSVKSGALAPTSTDIPILLPGASRGPSSVEASRVVIDSHSTSDRAVRRRLVTRPVGDVDHRLARRRATDWSTCDVRVMTARAVVSHDHARAVAGAGRRQVRLDARRHGLHALRDGASASCAAISGSTTTTAGHAGTVTLVMSGVGGLIFGYVADRFGRTRALMGTIALFSVASLGAATSQTRAAAAVLARAARHRHGRRMGVGRRARQRDLAGRSIATRPSASCSRAGRSATSWRAARGA